MWQRGGEFNYSVGENGDPHSATSYDEVTATFNGNIIHFGVKNIYQNISEPVFGSTSTTRK